MNAAAIRARRILHCALALHVLEFSEVLPEDARNNPRAILEDLQGSGALPEEVLLALDELVQGKISAALERKESPLQGFDLVTSTRAVAALSGRDPETRSKTRGGTPKTRLSGPGQRPASTIRGPFEIEPDDLLLLDAEQRCILQSASFAGAVLRQGLIDRQRLAEVRAEAEAADARLEDHLVASGVLDPMLAMDVFAEIQRPRPLCERCLQQLSPDADSCPNCRLRVGQGLAGVTQPAFPDENPAGDVSGVLADGQGAFGGYQLIERVAEGGMGVVFRARDRRLHRVVALKVMRGGSLASNRRRQRFVQEAEAVAALHHPNVVPIHQTGEISGYPYYTMDFVEGQTLDLYTESEPCAPQQVASLLREIAEGVHHFHLRGLIHRDLKPANILVTREGVPKIIDFGIAKKLTDRGSQSWTVEGDQLGTPHYMPPEQAAGRIQEIDVRSDVYALGAILYRLLAGVVPFHDVPETKLTAAIMEGDPISLRRHNPAVDADLLAIVERAMARDRRHRYQSSRELAQDLERYLALEPVHARRATFGYRLGKLVRRRRRQVLAVSGSFVALCALGVVLTLQSQARQWEAHKLIAEARTAPLDQRPHLLSQALGIDPQNPVATVELQAAKREIASQRRVAEELRLAEERSQREAAQRRADRLEELQRLERANAAVRAAEQRERARAEARSQARRDAETRARHHLDRARAADDPLEAFGSLSEGHLLVPEDSPLHAELELETLRAGLDLARRALTAQQAGLAEYWLRESRKLSIAGDHEETLSALELRVESLVSGRAVHAEARGLIGRGEWLAARNHLVRAAEQGVAPEILAADVELVNSMCRREAQRLLGEGRALLHQSNPAQALARARSALAYLDGAQREPGEALLEQCADTIVTDARAKACVLSARPEGAAQALDVLEQAARTVDETSAEAGLREELRHRALLLRDETLVGLVYLPAVPELDVKPCFLMAHEVTVRELAPFLAKASEVSNTSSQGDLPARGVTYPQARAYAKWMSERTGRTWRLPTKAEWEVASGWDPSTAKLRRYPWGETYAVSAIACGAEAPRLVGTSVLDRSPLGVHDTAGSVAEWISVDGVPGLKGAPFSTDRDMAGYLASVPVTGKPAPSPPPELLTGIGFRLVLEIEGQ